MTKKVCWLTVLLLSFGCTQAAHALAGQHGKGDPKRPISASSWPAGVSVLANREDRIGGHWVNASDWFQYAGDAKAFNDFLSGYARVSGQRLLILENGTAGFTFTGSGKYHPGYDWQLSVVGWGLANAAVTLPVGGRIALQDLNVPVEVDVDAMGTETAEMKAFLAAHRAKQEKARAGRTPK